MSINSTFSSLKCLEVQVEAIGDTVVDTLIGPFNREICKIGMEVITQGIKAALRMTRVEFLEVAQSVAQVTQQQYSIV